MRGPYWIVCLAPLFCATAGRAADVPYTAYVSSDDVYVRSGPGRNYYPTAKLRKGEKVEVYRHDPGGWYAIRPPRASFSWVSARQLDLAEAGVGVINTERAVARVGSIFSDVRDVIQVRLNLGERVELLEDHAVADGKWFKIAPPAGEFRWIHKDYLDRHPPDDQSARHEARPEDDQPGSLPPRRGTRGPTEIGLASAELADNRADEEEYERPRQSSRRAADVRTRRSARSTKPEPGKSFDQALADLDLDLSAMVAEEIGVWSFEDLRARGARLVDQAPTAIERGQARLVTSRIDRFAEIKERHDTLQQMRAETERRDRALNRAELARHEEPVSARFDGVGRLAMVSPRKEGMPPYVLLDTSGRIVTYVTPAPNINLRSFVNKRVGINGQRGYMPELKTPHLNAQHVSVLPDVRR